MEHIQSVEPQVDESIISVNQIHVGETEEEEDALPEIEGDILMEETPGPKFESPSLEPSLRTIEKDPFSSTCSTDTLVFREVDCGGLMRRALGHFVPILGANARFHKNIATRAHQVIGHATLPVLTLLEITKMWHDRHFFLDPG
ncbi:WVD2-like 1 [Striga asiatica]|uniref:WVD2-like 1 n=1 Tax=Striga asiatica TaxID=4170 RepID=A0A5A7QLI3_STRAF|nr:WVD2-like 1 [Striga asiatica]